MIAKCIAILAVVAQINASICGCGQSSVVLSSQPAVTATSGFSGVISRNLVAKGKYPVALSNNGPVLSQQIPVTTSQVTAPVQEKPIVRLPAQIPAPRIVSHTCTCYKTIVKPRVNQQVITVPTVQRYIETLHKPVVESVQYEAVPVNCNGVGSSFGGVVVSGSPVQAIQSIQVPSCGASIAQPAQVSYARPVEVSCAQPVQLQLAPAPVVQQVEIPQTFSLGSSSSCAC